MKKKHLQDENRRITIDNLTNEDVKKFNNKTRALSVQYLRPSTTENGYNKYEITYIEQGEVKYREIYGRDMQEAINRFAVYLRHKDTSENYTVIFTAMSVLLVIVSLSLILAMGWSLGYLAFPAAISAMMVFAGYRQDINTKKVLRGKV